MRRRGARHRDDAGTTRRGAAPPPDGWYPDPSGAAQWRRWDGHVVGRRPRCPTAPPPPDASSLLVERGAWLFLRTIAPWGLVAPALLAPRHRGRQRHASRRLRHWSCARACERRPAPPPAAPGAGDRRVLGRGLGHVLRRVAGRRSSGSARGSASSLASIARRGRRDATRDATGRRGRACRSSSPSSGRSSPPSASRAWLPAGPRGAPGARRSDGASWSRASCSCSRCAGGAVATSSLAAAWSVAAVCAACWLAAAVELPEGPRGDRRGPRLARRASRTAALVGSPGHADGHDKGAVPDGLRTVGSPRRARRHVGGQRGPRRLVPQRARQGQRDRRTARRRRSSPSVPSTTGRSSSTGSTTAPRRGAATRRTRSTPRCGYWLWDERDLQVMRCFMVPAGLDDHRGRHGGARTPPRSSSRRTSGRRPTGSCPTSTSTQFARTTRYDAIDHDRGRHVPLRRDHDRRALEELGPHLAHRPQHPHPRLDSRS